MREFESCKKSVQGAKKMALEALNSVSTNIISSPKKRLGGRGQESEFLSGSAPLTDSGVSSGEAEDPLMNDSVVGYKDEPGASLEGLSS